MPSSDSAFSALWFNRGPSLGARVLSLHEIQGTPRSNPPVDAKVRLDRRLYAGRSGL